VLRIYHGSLFLKSNIQADFVHVLIHNNFKILPNYLLYTIEHFTFIIKSVEQC
jgi:hypothetical protein